MPPPLNSQPSLSETPGLETDRATLEPSIRIPAILFFATILTTLAAGAIQQGFNPFLNPRALLRGIPFSFTLMAILLTHEMGHYLASRRHRVRASLPYFIPSPTFIGTFGAFIKIRSPIYSKAALLDIGAAGPLAGFVVAVAAIAIGLSKSTFTDSPPESMSLQLGAPLIFSFFERIILGPLPDGTNIILHPVAFAGWIGLFVTSLNLIPIGQLDGGHILYAILGRHARSVGLVMIGVLIAFGLTGWKGWLLWAVLPLLFGLGHPPVLDAHVSLDSHRRRIGWLTLVVFVLTFIPVPFSD
jgi:membrane-associated protease RseP (regulator of RpoE activity)